MSTEQKTYGGMEPGESNARAVRAEAPVPGRKPAEAPVTESATPPSARAPKAATKRTKK